jgi:hypothetical protein
MAITVNLGAIGVVPNKTVFNGIIKEAYVAGRVSGKWDATTGGDSKIDLKGTQAQIMEIANWCQEFGYPYEFKGGAVWTITVAFPLDVVTNNVDDEPDPVPRWELDWHPFEPNIMTLKDTPLVSVLSTQTKNNIEKALKNPGMKWQVASGNESAFVQAGIVHDLKQIGVDGKVKFRPILKRTIICSNAFNPEWGIDTSGEIFTTAELINTYGQGEGIRAMPQGILQRLPTSITMYNSDGTVAHPTDYFMTSDGIVVFVGWLEYPPRQQTINVYKQEVSQQWVFDAWSTGPWGLYPTAFAHTSPDPTSAYGG